MYINTYRALYFPETNAATEGTLLAVDAYLVASGLQCIVEHCSAITFMALLQSLYYRLDPIMSIWQPFYHPCY